MLAKVSKAELLAQLAMIRRMADRPETIGKWKVRIARSTGSQDVVCEVRTVDGKDWLCPVDCSAEGMAKILSAIMTDRELEAMDMDALVDELVKSEAADVVIGWPANGTFSVVVKVLALVKGDECVAYLFPGPADIDEVNDEILEYRRTHGCRAPQLDCDLCPDMMPGCPILEAAGGEARRRREGNAEEE